ncbi:LpqB family beta-propeller domain-containing protein [Pseudonocardia asaccharolytica]|uniref:Lipoprotein n=1 Tax=Pseudonocardia asaccharolytica DSM 44247 = NBRC 16224 TaxID=1123024 RepID=A0A511CWJ1_9PSEU|nr:LpqB family beta-propeller domain-containing protein [Pseudonocardia asaccharolytica]GEL16940.1 lipoprotein [Pseudonocardia asaccharolytica DSM 44247 = NBRC 16224]
MTGPLRRRLTTALAALLVVAGLAGCASVPQGSSVQVLRKVPVGGAPALPPGPADGTNPLDLVRGFVYASGSSTDRHGAARRFLGSGAASWDDGAALTVLDEQFDTVYAPQLADHDRDTTVVRIRGTQVGTLTPNGAFQPDESPVEVDVTVTRHDGQWRISRPPDGVLVRLSDFRSNYRTVKTYFIDPARGLAVPDVRYLPVVPARAQASRAVELLLNGPSAALTGAATSELPPGARLRSNVAETPDGAVLVDLTQVGTLDGAARRRLAAQVVLTLSEVNVGRIRLLVDGAPLLPGDIDLTRDDVTALSAGVDPRAVPQGLVVAGGRVRQLTSGEPGSPIPGQAGNGDLEVLSAATTVDGRTLAVVSRESGRPLLRIGSPDGPLQAVALDATSMTRPSCTATGEEVWTVLDGTTVARVLLGPTGEPRIGRVDGAELADLGVIQDLRLSRDGMRVAAVVGGKLVTAVVARRDGEAVIRNARVLRPGELGEVVAVDWRAPESVLVANNRADRPVMMVTVDGLAVQTIPSINLTPPLRAVTAFPGRALLVADQGGVWSFSSGELDTWRQVLGGVPEAIPFYPG